jgi:hypothetical protein
MVPKPPDRRDARNKAQGVNRSKSAQISLRVSDDAKHLLSALADKYGFNLTHALEYALRKIAIEEGLWDIKPATERTPRKRG